MLLQVIPLVNKEVEEGDERDLCCEENVPKPSPFGGFDVVSHDAAVDVDDPQE